MAMNHESPTPGLNVAIELPRQCLNCRHWRDKAWTDKGWGICDNQKNEAKVFGTALFRAYLKDLPDAEQAIKELTDIIEDGIRYPQDFGCNFFEPAHWQIPARPEFAESFINE